MATSSIDIAYITEHLKRRPIAAILERCDEKDDFIALKLMCIIDHDAEDRNLYTQINGFAGDLGPKLLTQLFQFRQFGKFRFYQYLVNRRLNGFILQCKFCELTGSFEWILTHVAINHNTHTGLKKCTFCNKKEFEQHFDDHSMADCCRKYIEKYQIAENKNRDNIAADCYDMVKDVAKKLGLYTVRHHGFRGHTYGSVEKLGHDYSEDVSNECTVFHAKSRGNNRTIDGAKLNEEFERVSKRMFGKQSSKRKSQASIETIVISDDESESNNTRNVAGPSTSAQSNRGNENQSSSAADETNNSGPRLIGPRIIIKRERSSSSTSAGPSMVVIPAPNSNNQNVNTSTANEATSDVKTETKSDSGDWLQRSQSEQFGLYVAQRLSKLPDERDRQVLEIDIQEAVLKAEKAAIVRINPGQ